MTLSNERNKYNQNRTQENWPNYKKQRNKRVNILREEKTEYFNNLDVKTITENVFVDC